MTESQFRGRVELGPSLGYCADSGKREYVGIIGQP